MLGASFCCPLFCIISMQPYLNPTFLLLFLPYPLMLQLLFVVSFYVTKFVVFLYDNSLSSSWIRSCNNYVVVIFFLLLIIKTFNVVPSYFSLPVWDGITNGMPVKLSSLSFAPLWV